MKSIQFKREVNMKAIKLFQVLVVLAGILLSACTAAPAASSVPGTSSAGGDKPQFSEVVFTGVIDGMQGDQWVINGQPVKVDPSTLRDGPFVVGDTVKVEALVAGDGSVTAQRVESPSARDLTEVSSTPQVSSTQAPVFDDSGSEAVGAVEALTETSITLGGQTYTFAPGAEIKGLITVGMIVKLHFVANADGSLSVREVEAADPTQIGSNSNDNSNGANANDDNSNSNSNDDNSNDDNGNDDNGNDDNGNDDNGNDDNSNDSNGNG